MTVKTCRLVRRPFIPFIFNGARRSSRWKDRCRIQTDSRTREELVSWHFGIRGQRHNAFLSDSTVYYSPFLRFITDYNFLLLLAAFRGWDGQLPERFVFLIDYIHSWVMVSVSRPKCCKLFDSSWANKHILAENRLIITKNWHLPSYVPFMLVKSGQYIYGSIKVLIHIIIIPRKALFGLNFVHTISHSDFHQCSRATITSTRLNSRLNEDSITLS